MLFMQKKTGSQEKAPRQLRKEPTVLPEKVAKFTKDFIAPLSKSKIAEIEGRKAKVKDFDEFAIANLNGFIGACLIDSETGTLLARTQCEELDVGADTFSTEKVNAKLKAVKDLGLGIVLEDIVITLESQYHLIRRLKSATDVFIYLVVDRNASNLGLAKFTLQTTEESIVF